MIRNSFISKKTTLTVLSCVASVVLLASCSSSGDDGGGAVNLAETSAGTVTAGTGTGTGTGTVTGGGNGTGTITGGGNGTGTITGGTGTGTATSGTGTGTATSGTGTGTATSGTGTATGGGDNGASLVGFYEMTSLDLTDDADGPIPAPPGFGYLDIGQLDDGSLSFILLIADFDLNCTDVVVATPITSSGGSAFIDAAGDEFSITQNGSNLTVLIEPLSMTFSPANGISFLDLQLCDF